MARKTEAGAFVSSANNNKSGRRKKNGEGAGEEPGDDECAIELRHLLQRIQNFRHSRTTMLSKNRK